MASYNIVFKPSIEKDLRYLIIFFIFKKRGDALVLSARDMTHEERKRYEKT